MSIVIDCRDADLERAAAFWSGALGRRAKPRSRRPALKNYRALGRTWWVMQAPTGHRFCVVRPQRGPLGKDANRWR